MEQMEMQLIAAMAASPECFHEAMSLGADKLITGGDALYCLKQFDLKTGAFDEASLIDRKATWQAYREASQDIFGNIGSFRLQRLIQRVRLGYQQARMLHIAKDKYETPDEQISAMSSCILELGDLCDNGQSEQEEIEEALKAIDERAAGKPTTDVLPWPLDWMERLGGIGKQEFIVLGGRPGSGKSALMGQVCLEMAYDGKRVMFITLEMSRNELRHRFSAYKTGYSCKRIDGLDPNKAGPYRSNFERIASMDNLLLREHYSIGAIISAISREKIKGLDAVFIDYLQLISGTKGVSRLEQLSDITRSIKITAKDLRIPIFCGSQLNRQSEAQERPHLSSLRESGTIEQDADRVILLHETDTLHEVIQAKCRNGKRDLIEADFNGETTSFSNHKLI